jgi:hypothetical protein
MSAGCILNIARIRKAKFNKVTYRAKVTRILFLKWEKRKRQHGGIKKKVMFKPSILKDVSM